MKATRRINCEQKFEIIEILHRRYRALRILKGPIGLSKFDFNFLTRTAFPLVCPQLALQPAPYMATYKT